MTHWGIRLPSPFARTKDASAVVASEPRTQFQHPPTAGKNHFDQSTTNPVSTGSGTDATNAIALRRAVATGTLRLRPILQNRTLISPGDRVAIVPRARVDGLSLIHI